MHRHRTISIEYGDGGSRRLRTLIFFHANYTSAIMREETNARTAKLWTVSRALGMVVPMNRHGTYERVNYSGVRVK